MPIGVSALLPSRVQFAFTRLVPYRLSVVHDRTGGVVDRSRGPSSRDRSARLPHRWNPAVRTAGYRRLVIRAITALLLSVVAAGAGPAGAAGLPANVDANRIAGADQDPANWLTYGRTYSEQRFSPLARITADNVKQLGLAWYADLETSRGQEATPLVIDGVMYVSTAWSMVKAYDAKTGALLWSYDPEVPRALGVGPLPS
jgi:glucose dehydrogenase